MRNVAEGYAHTNGTDSRIDHDNIVLIFLMKMIYKLSHRLNGIPFGVQRERPPSVHVVNVGPHSLQRDPGTTVVINYLSHFEYVLITVSALVKLEPN